jgi:hypothetical protein
MLDEIEQVNSDENTTASSEPSEPVEQNTSEPASQAPANTNQEEKSLPFHEHPRWKEVIAERSELKTRLQEYERRFQELETRTKPPEPAKQEDALVARLKQIDPEFGQRFETLNSQLDKLKELESWKEQYEAEQTRTAALDMVSKLHSEHKVSAEMQELYNAQLELAASRNPKLGLKDVPALYKSVHEQMSKLFDNVRRTERESYVVDKRKDSAIPSQPKGKPAPSSQPKGDLPMDPDERRKAISALVLKDMRTQSG